MIACVRSVGRWGRPARGSPTSEEGQRHDREEGQEREVRDTAGLHVPADAGVVRLHAERVVDEGALRAHGRDPRAARAPSGTTSASAHVPVGQREVAGGLPADHVVVDVEVEARDVELALEVGELAERPVQQVVGQVVGDRDVRVVRERDVDVERPAAYGGRQLLAAGDPLDDRHEHHRRDGTEGAGAAQVHAEAPELRGDVLEVLLDLVEVGVGHLGRWDQGDVRGDHRGGGVTDRGPVVLELGGPGLRDGQGDADGGHSTDPTVPPPRSRPAGRRRAASPPPRPRPARRPA